MKEGLVHGGNWTFTNTTNSNMTRFIGKSVDVATPCRKDDGHRVGFIYDPGNPDNWYFYTSTVESINKCSHLEDGYTTLEIRTRNSVYWFYKKIQ